MELHQFQLLVALLLLSAAGMSPAGAQLQVGVSGLEAGGGNAAVTLRSENRFGQDLTAARAWVFLVDAEGKVVGQKAQWIVGDDPGAAKPVLKPEEEMLATLVVPTTGVPVSAKVTFSRIVMADGSLPNLETDVVPFPEESK